MFDLLKKRGLKFRKHYRLLGNPDVVFLKEKIAIFIDGDFWHGKYFKKEQKNYSEFWVNKILNNINRDKLANETLKNDGWKVIRLWKTDILKNPTGCVDSIEAYLWFSLENLGRLI